VRRWRETPIKEFRGQAHEGLAEIIHSKTQEVKHIRIPNVTIRAYIGAGANGIVFEGIDTVDREVAVKVYPPRARQSVDLEALRGKALAEVRKLARLKRVGLPTIYFLGQSDENWPIVVMEYGGRRSIRDQKAQIMNRDSAYRMLILSGVLDVLKYAEDRGVLHGDMHFGNVLVDDDILDVRQSLQSDFDISSKIEVIDFGTSRLAGQNSSEERHARLLQEFTYRLLPELSEWCKPSPNLAKRSGREMLPRMRAALSFYMSVRLASSERVRIEGIPPRDSSSELEILGMYLRDISDFDLVTIFQQLSKRYSPAQMMSAKVKVVEYLGMFAGLGAIPSTRAAIDGTLLDLLAGCGFIIDESAREAVVEA